MPSPLLASAALGLLSAWPVGALGLGLGRLVERLTDDPRPRAAAWSLAYALPVGALAATVALTLAPAALPGALARGGDPAHRLAASLDLPGAPLPSAWRPHPLLAEGAAWCLVALSGVGLAARVAVGARGRRRLKAIRAKASLAADPALTAAVAAHAARLDVSPAPVLISHEIGEPLLAGTARPAILLPKALTEAGDPARLALVCAHELAHLRRGDNWRLPIEDALAGLFWLAPPVSALRARMTAAREAVCDLAALDGAPPQARRDYARLLVDALRANALPAAQSAFTGRQRSLVEMRLSAILQPRQAASPTRLALTLALSGVLTTATGAGSLALAREARQSQPPQAPPRAEPAAPARPGFFDVMANTQETSSNKVTFNGAVTVRGDPDPATYTLRVNGAPAPAGFRIETLPDGAIQRMEVIHRKATQDGKTAINIILATPTP
ncbi:peptidase M56 [Caulobacter segnis]|uniref:Peptidase M56 BlaR1 n=2 Tax=Caulobacter segnis TaxID=88688 RepID=D5VI58_CAUST|nr:M56 family metallopeptidase [Caulobacter segnis]ADG09311.1 peptidase M56 BlaR1 [Caulobacter segnis ATCC 21756]AVQ01115.1 peptidase M56 [Caulobacter segnis]